MNNGQQGDKDEVGRNEDASISGKEPEIHRGSKIEEEMELQREGLE